MSVGAVAAMKINSVVALSFLLVFGVYVVNSVINVSHLENPIVDMTATAMGIND